MVNPKDLTPISAVPRLMGDESDVLIVPTTRVRCDGGGGALGHPVTWLDMGEDDHVICKYCDRVFKLDPDAAPAAH